uniref:Uncharacterized protein n=1 Tax=Lepeophtheirus salmonis TaxID=72036 RepID=A0A0K2SV46_LEPSM
MDIFCSKIEYLLIRKKKSRSIK